MARTLRFGSRVSAADLDHRISRYVSSRRTPQGMDAARAAEDAARHMGLTSYVPRPVTFGKRDRTTTEVLLDRQADAARDLATRRHRFLED